MRGVADALRASGKSEAVAQVIDLQLAMMDLLQKHQELFAEATRLRAQVVDLEKALIDRGNIEFHFEAYWRRLPDGKFEGPFSPHCFDKDGRLYRMHYRGLIGPDILEFACLESEKFSSIPLRFVKESTNWTEDEIHKR